MTAPRRGRGRPAIFDTAARGRYLEALTAGATKKDAAAAAGIAPKTVRNARQADGKWREAEDAAYARGTAARQDRLPHGESRYNHHRCRCPICTKEATAARTGRPDRTPKGATITPIIKPDHPPDQGSPKDFPLADAS